MPQTDLQTVCPLCDTPRSTTNRACGAFGRRGSQKRLAKQFGLHLAYEPTDVCPSCIPDLVAYLNAYPGFDTTKDHA